MALDASVAAFSLGSDVQNDVILTDAPFKSVQLSVNAMGFLWDAQGACAQVKVDQGVRAGSLALSLSSAASPWSDEPPAGWAVDQPSEPLQPPVAKLVGDQDANAPAKASPLPQPSSLRPDDPQASAAQSSADPDAGRELSHSEKAVTAGPARRRRVGWLWGVALGGTLAMGVALPWEVINETSASFGLPLITKVPDPVAQATTESEIKSALSFSNSISRSFGVSLSCLALAFGRFRSCCRLRSHANFIAARRKKLSLSQGVSSKDGET